MKNIEDIVIDKICEIVNLGLSKVIKPDIKLDKVTQLDEKMIIEIKEKYNIEGIILDVDDTLRKNLKRIPKCNEEWIDTVKKQLKIIVVSNGIDKDIEEFFKEKEIDYIGFAQKPLKKSFLMACQKINLDPDKILVIGDNIIDDIYGGKINKMKTALIKEVDER